MGTLVTKKFLIFKFADVHGLNTSTTADIKLPFDVTEPAESRRPGRVGCSTADRSKLFPLSYKLMSYQLFPKRLLGSKQLHIVNAYHKCNKNYISMKYNTKSLIVK